MAKQAMRRSTRTLSCGMRPALPWPSTATCPQPSTTTRYRRDQTSWFTAPKAANGTAVWNPGIR
eukprot:11222838-Lingulodinium_polyedra.AAC.1